MLIDTHAHVNFKDFKNDSDEIIIRALTENIWMINVGAEKDTSRRAIEYAKKYPAGVFAVIGLHPSHLVDQEYDEKAGKEIIKYKTSAEKFDYDFYKNLAFNEKVVAIGEIGLDYYRGEEHKDLQKQVFIKQLELATEIGMPVIIHCREAHNDMLEILKAKDGLRGVIHSFSGRWSQAEEYLKMGFYLGFNGIITFARDYDRVVKEMPLEKMLLETDCPYLAPFPFRGKRNEPVYVKYIAEKVAELRNLSFKEVADTTTENARRLFGM